MTGEWSGWNQLHGDWPFLVVGQGTRVLKRPPGDVLHVVLVLFINFEVEILLVFGVKTRAGSKLAMLDCPDIRYR
jgi:hypothetical protein